MSVWKGRALFDIREVARLLILILHSSLVMFLLYVGVSFWFFTYLKYFIIGKDVDWKRSKGGNDTKIVVSLTYALIMHVFKLDCYSHPCIRNTQRVKNQAGGMSHSPGIFKLGAINYILRESCRWHWRMLVWWGEHYLLSDYEIVSLGKWLWSTIAWAGCS